MDVSYQLIPLQGKDNDEIGSLLRMFQSQYFTVAMLVLYLKKYFENKGIHDYLINQLYSFQDNELEFYLPQLWFFFKLLFFFMIFLKVTC